MKRKDLLSEMQNPLSMEIDSLPVGEILTIINSEDQKIAKAIQSIIPEIETTVNLAVKALQAGGHIFYIGAGTSGRLGVLDASEIPPTFSAPHEWFQGIIAGGEEALVRSIEGAEDSSEDAIQDLKKCHFSKHDLLVGISCSGSAKYVVSALDYARSLGAFTAYLVTNKAPYRATKTDVLMAVNIGPEVVTGSTRMKAGTATKLILNMISTATMIRMGKTLGNLMVDLQVVNEKLLDRGRRIISEITGFEAKKSEKLLRESGMSVKTAIVMGLMQCSAKDAIAKLEKNEGFLRRVLSE